MRKFQLLGGALIAVFAFGVLVASASAVNTFLLAEWLMGGLPVVSELLVEILGELLLEDTNVPIIGKSMVLCDGLFDGWVGPNSLDWLSEVLDLEDHPITGDLTGTSLNCTAQTGCETNTTVLVWPFGLPKETEVELLEGDNLPAPIFIVLIFGTIGYHISECLVFGVPQEDLCESAGGAGVNTAAAQLLLEGTTLLGDFSKEITELVGLKLATCTVGGANSGLVDGSGNFIVSGTEELTASSDELSA